MLAESLLAAIPARSSLRLQSQNQDAAGTALTTLERRWPRQPFMPQPDPAPPRRPLRPLALIVAVAFHAVLLVDCLFHDPTISYDSKEHSRYVHTLAKIHLPGGIESDEFFSPPGVYLAPALLRRAGVPLF